MTKIRSHTAEGPAEPRSYELDRSRISSPWLERNLIKLPDGWSGFLQLVNESTVIAHSSFLVLVVQRGQVICQRPVIGYYGRLLLYVEIDQVVLSSQIIGIGICIVRRGLEK